MTDGVSWCGPVISETRWLEYKLSSPLCPREEKKSLLHNADKDSFEKTNRLYTDYVTRFLFWYRWTTENGSPLLTANVACHWRDSRCDYSTCTRCNRWGRTVDRDLPVDPGRFQSCSRTMRVHFRNFFFLVDCYGNDNSSRNNYCFSFIKAQRNRVFSEFFTKTRWNDLVSSYVTPDQQLIGGRLVSGRKLRVIVAPSSGHILYA